uniref:VOC domain-containing protein n=1 Tax=Phlebotomus papatasi TaxID=29031 RepID=A0A1B0D2W8_PHLPP
MIPGRALHYVLKIGDRAKNIHFFKNILGMKVLRHEEFTEGCDAQCNGPYDNRWSKTMIGFGPESDFFVVELTYNYGVKSYELGNDFGGITIHDKDILSRAKNLNYEISKDGEREFLTSPDGYKFFIENAESTSPDKVTKVTLHCTNLKQSLEYWVGLLDMKILCQEDNSATLSYDEKQTSLELKEISDPLNRAKAYGRIAFAVPADIQPQIDEKIKANKGTILTPLISLDTPGKATVQVIILGDPDGHEICFVNEEGFSELSQVDPKSDESLEKYIKKDPFQ